ncbi:hypothetical protein [Kutzneria buriramensis]|uniref:hypothetical protein n=1 Tax=Kutzneria buriramensis TaxID=1045776 RepID=UPI0011C0F3C9|nr:hypothetical protein [Kutzneria buriramensis]
MSALTGSSSADSAIYAATSMTFLTGNFRQLSDTFKVRKTRGVLETIKTNVITNAQRRSRAVLRQPVADGASSTRPAAPQANTP